VRWKGIGVASAIIVAALIALGRAGVLAVDWAWFSTIGYVGVFWTVLATKAVLFTTVFATSTLLLWVNAALALRFRTGSTPLASSRGQGTFDRGADIARNAERAAWNELPAAAVAPA
jgi:uncharacterized protein